MSTAINTNISALAAQSSLRKTGINQSTAMERLSTGVRINNAKDDAAGLAITTRMTANIRGMAAAIRNSNDGISLTQTAEGSLSAIQDNLQRIRELAVQSANSGNTSSDRASMNLEAQQLISEIDRVATNSTFNGSKLLDGSFANQSFQVGAGSDSTDRISISISNAKAGSLGTVGGTTSTRTATAVDVLAGALSAGDLTIKGFAIGATVSDGVSTTNSTQSAIAKANAINAASGNTGVTAKASDTTVSITLTSSEAIVAGDLFVNGVDIGSLSAATDSTSRAVQLVGAINSKSSLTGVTAKNTNNILTLTAADGRNITLTKAGSPTGLNGVTGAPTTSYGKLTLSTELSAPVTITGTANGYGYTGLTAQSDLSMTAGTVTGQTVSSVDLSTQSGAQKSLTILDSAINTVTDSRANLGAYQNRFSAAISNLETTSTNLQASRSRILDTDYAKETTMLAKSQIVTQAATAMLAQANQSAQSVLALLK